MKLFNNNVEKHFKKISITGRIAFGIKCLEEYLTENKIRNVWTNRLINTCLLYTSPSPRDRQKSRMPSSA